MTQTGAKKRKLRKPTKQGKAARNRWLPEGRRGPMPWIIGIMMFLTILSAAAGLALAGALTQMHNQMAGGYTVQIVEANAALRSSQSKQIAALLRAEPAIENISVISDRQLAEQLAPWIGKDIPAGELPIPALIDIETRPGTTAATMAALTRKMTAIAPSLRIDAHENYLGPIEQLMRALMWVAIGLVALMIAVTGAVVMLAARSAQATHRATIDIMHHLGATDIQIARLFQRRMALDAVFGSALGLGAATGLLWLLHSRIIATDSELAGMMSLHWSSALLLVLIPAGGVILAMLTARITVRRALERIL